MKYLGRLSCRYRKMSEPVIKHELFEYDRKRPFKVYIVNSDNEEKAKVKLLNHWHEELEMVYLAEGTSTHYINGECIHAKKGQLIVTNSGFIHSIIPDFQMQKRKAVVFAVVEFVMLIWCFFGCKEHIGENEAGEISVEEVPLGEAFPALLKNQYFYIQALLFLTLYVGIVSSGASGYYFASTVLGDVTIIGMLSAATTIPAMIADVVDYGEWKTGVRSEDMTEQQQYRQLLQYHPSNLYMDILAQ